MPSSRDYKAEYTRKNRPRINAMREADRKSGDIRRMAQSMIARMSSLTKSKGLEPRTFVQSDVVPLFEAQGGRCALTHRPLVLEAGTRHPDMISADRIDQTRGYVKGNVRFITHQANLARSIWTDTQLLEFAADVVAAWRGM